MKFDVIKRTDIIANQKLLIEALGGELEKTKTELRTANNRLQGSDGKGNAGESKKDK
jgi:hypothetical protein